MFILYLYLFNFNLFKTFTNYIFKTDFLDDDNYMNKRKIHRFINEKKNNNNTLRIKNLGCIH